MRNHIKCNKKNCLLMYLRMPVILNSPEICVDFIYENNETRTIFLLTVFFCYTFYDSCTFDIFYDKQSNMKPRGPIACDTHTLSLILSSATTFSSSDENQILNQLNVKWCWHFMSRHTKKSKK